MCDKWKRKFFKVYFDEDSTTKEIDAVLDIKNNNIPQYLYKYTDIGHIDDLLENCLFYLPEIEKLNDPFEGNILYDLDLQIKRFMRFWLERTRVQFKETHINKMDLSVETNNLKIFLENNKIPLKKILTQTDEELIISNMKKGKLSFAETIEKMSRNNVKKFFETLSEIIRKDTKVACLTESKYNNPLWNHYANEHKGICIEYESTKFSQLLKNNCFPIFYDNAPFSDNIPIKDVEKLKEKYNLKAFLKKSEDWRCENEWRIIITSNMHEKCNEYYENNMHKYLKLKPKSIYLGKDFSKNDKKDQNKIIKICKDNDINIFQMKQLKTQYQLKKEQLSV